MCWNCERLLARTQVVFRNHCILICVLTHRGNLLGAADLAAAGCLWVTLLLLCACNYMSFTVSTHLTILCKNCIQYECGCEVAWILVTWLEDRVNPLSLIITVTHWSAISYVYLLVLKVWVVGLMTVLIILLQHCERLVKQLFLCTTRSVAMRKTYTIYTQLYCLKLISIQYIEAWQGDRHPYNFISPTAAFNCIVRTLL